MEKRNFNNENLYLKEYKNYLIEEDKSLRTIETYLENVNGFINYLLEFDQSLTSIDEVSSVDIIEYRTYCSNKKNSVATINIKLSSLNSYFNFLVQMKKVSRNPVQQVKKIRADSKGSYIQKTFDDRTFKSLRRLYYRESNPLHICIFELLSKTGMRASELCELKLENFDVQVFDPNARSGKVGFVGKGNRFREIPLHHDVRKAIQEWMKIRELKKIDNEYLLVSERKEKFTTGGLRSIARKYHSQIPGCNNYSLHSYRHYFATALLRGTPPVDIVIVQKLLGHASIMTTQIYTQANYSDLETAISNISNG